MKIALVFPRFRYPCGDPPLGVGYLASFLMNHNPGIEVDILDTTFEPDPARFLASKFKNHDYKIVGISAMTPMWPQASTVAGMVKSSSPESFVVLGGPHPTVLPEESLQKGSVDAVCIGEGEETLSELADHLDSPESVKGLVLKKKRRGSFHRNARLDRSFGPVAFSRASSPPHGSLPEPLVSTGRRGTRPDRHVRDRFPGVPLPMLVLPAYASDPVW